MHTMLVIVRTENMEWIHEHACREYMSKHALKTWEQLMELQSIGCRIRCWDIGTYKDWKHEHACSEYMQAIEKLYMHMCTTIYNKNTENIVCNSMCTWWWVCACILAWKQFMETIHGTSVDRLSNTMHRFWWLYALKTWSEYMNKHAVNTCKQWWKYTCICVLQF